MSEWRTELDPKPMEGVPVWGFNSYGSRIELVVLSNGRYERLNPTASEDCRVRAWCPVQPPPMADLVNKLLEVIEEES